MHIEELKGGEVVEGGEEGGSRFVGLRVSVLDYGLGLAFRVRVKA